MKFKNLIMMALPVVVFAASVVSCEEEKDTYIRPSFSGITQEPNPVTPGEQVVLTIGQKEKGNGIAGVTYTWTIKDLVPDPDDPSLRKDTVLNVHTNYDGYDKQDPVLKFKVPANCSAGKYTVIMKALFSCYIDDVLFDEATVQGKLVIK